MEPDLTCKRCSVTRVNALVEAYQQTHSSDDHSWRRRLRQVETLCKSRGFSQAGRLLQPGLTDKKLRALCWNVSSFIKENEAETILGIKLDPNRATTDS